MTRLSIFLAAACAALAAASAPGGGGRGWHSDHRRREPASKIAASSFAPKRTTPVFRDEFVVDLVFITFPDCEGIDVQQATKDLARVRGSTITAYFKEYSQGITWPVLRAYARPYMAPHPLGWNCRHNPFSNRIGFKGDEGGARAAQLRSTALAAMKKSRYLDGSPSGKTAVTCYVYCKSLSGEKVESLLRPFYPKKEDGKDEIGMYKPPIPWRDPLWPNSIPQVFYPGDGGTLVHELGHVLGAPDFYHATEKYDGMPGSPSLPWSWGPTGPAYCRYIYQAFLPATAYPMVTKSGPVTLAPRATNPAADRALGCFVPSAHPNYLFCIEYAKNEKPPIGSPENEGLLVHVINVTFSSPMLGPPDLCYTYRPNDPWHRAIGGETGAAYLHDGDVFDEKSDPAAVLPNLIPAGVAIRNIRLSGDVATFDLEVQKTRLPPREVSSSLLPKVALGEVDEVLSTSFRARCDVRYRGEPLLTEYGFCYDTAPHPTGARGRFPLYHRDRYDGRILGLQPGKTYYVRAYARNQNGVTYSEEEKKVTLLPAGTVPDSVPPLLTDRIRGNFFYNRWYFGVKNDLYVTANPLLAMMSIAAYYRVLPGHVRGKPPFDMTRVHVNPSESRPDFRMHEVNALRHRMEGLVARAGLRQRDFDRQWDKTFCAALGFRSPAGIVVPVSKETISAFARQIRESVAQARPVMLVREGSLVPPDTGVFHPIDIALIDGYIGDDAFHASFPTGSDRGLRKDGHLRLEDLFDHVERARLVFYAPPAAK